MIGNGALHARLQGRCGHLRLDAELQAPVGTVTHLTGASGAGKTTLLRAIAGLERLEGEVRLGGDVWQDHKTFLPTHRRGVGLAFQHDALFPHVDVAANLRFGAQRGGGRAGGIDAVVALLALEPLLQRRPDELSGGERRRVALGRALAMRPRLLLLDEPLSGLDTEAKAILLPHLRDALRQTAIPVLLVSHDAADGAGLADRRLHLQSGVIRHDNAVDRGGASL